MYPIFSPPESISLHKHSGFVKFGFTLHMPNFHKTPSVLQQRRGHFHPRLGECPEIRPSQPKLALISSF